MSAKLLVDTNVWLDFFDGSRAGNAVADRLVRHAVERGDDLLYAVGTATDVYYVMRATAKRLLRAEYGELDDDMAGAAEGAAWDCICSLREIATCVGADESDFWLAEKARGLHRDLEDDLVIAAAQRSGATALVTSDEALARHAPVAAMTPADVLAFRY